MAATNYNVLAPVAGTQAISATSSTAVGLTVPSPSTNQTKANYAFCVAETNSVRWRDDGTDPTATVGMLLQPNVGFVYDGNLSALKFISTGAQAIVTVAYYRNG